MKARDLFRYCLVYHFNFLLLSGYGLLFECFGSPMIVLDVGKLIGNCLRLILFPGEPLKLLDILKSKRDHAS